MKHKKFVVIILIVVSILTAVSLCVFDVIRRIAKVDDIPFMSAYGLDFSTNSGSEARERMGTADSTRESPVEEHLYFSYVKAVNGKAAEVSLVTNLLTDYFCKVLVTWQFDSEQEAEEWYEEVRHQIREDYGFLWSFQDNGESTLWDGAPAWDCCYGKMFCHINIHGTKVILSAQER